MVRNIYLLPDLWSENRGGRMNVYDKHGIPIFVGDVIKVFHFIGARRKKYFMYKHVISEETVGNGTRFFKLSHLNLKDGGYYNLRAKDQVEECFEIVQGYAGVRTGLSFENRERKTK